MFTEDSPVVQDENGLQAPELGGPRPQSRTHSLRPSVDMEPASPPAGLPHFEPLGDADVYDVFDLELILGAGGKEAGIDARYRSLSDSSSGRPTYKIQKKTRAHFLGKKNMTVDVGRSAAWDPMNATSIQNGSKSYANVFSAKDQPSRSVALTATNSVLAKSAMGAVIDVSSVCGSYDPSSAPRRETPAHHFFTLKLNESCAASRPAPANGIRNKRAKAAPPPAPAAAPREYTGGGHFVLDATPHGRSDLLSTLYCTGYEQRPHARRGDVVVAELRVRPAEPGTAAPPAWARFFKTRHASLHVARRGLDACMTGPHVHMLVPAAAAAGRVAVLARGQALEVVLAALGTALLALEHDGLESKRWAWLVHGAAPPPPLTKPTLAQLAPAPAMGDNPGLASPDAEGSDSSQGSPSSLAYDQPGGGLYPGYSADRNFIPGDGESGIEMDEWVPKDDPFAGPLPPHGHAGAELPQPPVGTWARKGSFGSRPSTPRTVSQQAHLKAGSWPEKQSHRRSVIMLERKDSVSSGQGHEFPLMERKDGQGHDLLPIGKPPLSTFTRAWGDGHPDLHPHPQQERDMIAF